MLLVIDAGNTETVFGLFEDGRLISHCRLSSRQHRTPDEWWLFLEMWCLRQKYSTSAIEGVVISSVVPLLSDIFTKVSNEHLGLKPIVVDADLDTGLKILYDSPRTIGADRICNAVAGYKLYGGPLIIVDFGTAITFDVISEVGDYLGGAIALGLKAASQELHRIAAKLPGVELKFPDSVVGKTTEMSIKSGIMWGTVSLVDGMIRKIAEEMNWKKFRVIATGGVAHLIVDKIENIERVEPFLVLEGMRLIYNRLKRVGEI